MRKFELKPPYDEQPNFLKSFIETINNRYCTELYYDEFDDLVTTIHFNKKEALESGDNRKRLCIKPDTLEIYEC